MGEGAHRADAARVERLFVYGTLRRGGAVHALLGEGAALEDDAWIAARLHDAGEYPAAVPTTDAGERVRGEVYRLAPSAERALLARLDAYEGYRPGTPGRSLFRREVAEATLGSGQRVRAWVYFYDRGVRGMPRIASGDYLAPRAGQGAGPP